MKPNYYAVIPAEVRYNEKLTANSKLLYGEISALSNKKGMCWATNKYFADLYNVSEVSISKWVAQLIDQALIRTQTNHDGKREIYLIGIKEKFKGVQRKVKGGVKEKFKPNSNIYNIYLLIHLLLLTHPSHTKGFGRVNDRPVCMQSLRRKGSQRPAV